MLQSENRRLIINYVEIAKRWKHCIGKIFDRKELNIEVIKDEELITADDK